MINAALRDAMKRTGVSAAQLAKQVFVNPKTVNNWINRGAIPRRETQMAVVKILGCQIHDLWADQAPPISYALSEIVNAWGHRCESPKDLWWKLFEGAEEYVDLLGYAMQFFHEDHKDFVALLKDKANDGCQVRIIMADPQSSAANERDHEEDLRGGLIARIKTSLTYFEPVIGLADIEIRLQSYPMYNSIFRFDGEMLVTPHLCHDPGRLAPLFHVRQGSEEGIFQRYLESFDYVFETSRAIRPSFV
jgi:transcriptional regulator with XRE-family HTH domain